MLKVRQEVLCRIDSISATRGAEVTVIDTKWMGTIRLQDIGNEISDIRDAFRPGDVVRATTLSTGDVKSSFFSTVAPQCGVVMAKEGEDWLQPVDQSHMRAADGTVYRRKVARPINQISLSE